MKIISLLIIGLCVTPQIHGKNQSGGVNELNVYMILAQRFVESHGDYRAISHKNCHGPMQVNPATAREYGIPEWSLTHPVLGMDAGIRIMEYYWVLFHGYADRWALSLAAYNCGYGRTIKSYLTLGHRWQQGVPSETRSYILKVQNRYYKGVK
jgi:soluble lytic murein transglycosylase-like protein